MKYEIKYEGTEVEKRAKALADCREWLGEDRYTAISEEYKKAGEMTLETGMFYLEFAGIAGYAARVFVEEFANLKTKEE